MEDYIIEMQHITKTFTGIIANDDITLNLKRGEIHALLGENGAGKSTLMSVLFGLYNPEGGIILKDGKEVHIKNPNDANKLGIGMVHQHFMLIDCFTGLENIILGAEPTDFVGVLHPKAVRKEIEDLCKKYKFKVDLDAKISDMSVGMQQKIEILKMLFRKNEILIFDEPTAVLTPQEIEELMNSMKELIKEGKSILFISHKLNEIMEVADRVTVLRKGKLIGTLNVADTDVHQLSRMMVGREVQLVVQKNVATIGKPILSVKNLSIYSHTKHKDVVKNVSFEARAGEITCVAGIEGNGQSELVYGITGLIPVASGQVIIHDVDIHCIEEKKDKNVVPEYKDLNIEKMSIRKRNLAGISHIPEDRHKYGLILDFPLKNNMVLQRYFESQFSSHGWINFKAIKYYSDGLIKKYDVRSGQGSNSLTRSMSGGNQQKAIVARELDRNTSLLIAVQPTRGMDVGAIEYIHNQLIARRDDGKAVLLISLELDEVMNLADRILVMYEGEIVADLDPKKTNVMELGLYMAGAKRMALDGSTDNMHGNVKEEKTQEIASSLDSKNDNLIKSDALAEKKVSLASMPIKSAKSNKGVSPKKLHDKKTKEELRVIRLKNLNQYKTKPTKENKSKETK